MNFPTLRPDLLPPSSAFNGGHPVRLDGRTDMGPLAGQGVWRGVKDFEHGALCRVFGLDPNRFYFDLPSSVRGTGSNMSGAGGSGRGNRIINGYVMCAGYSEPVGKLTILKDARTGLRDDDPVDARSFLDLSRT